MADKEDVDVGSVGAKGYWGVEAPSQRLSGTYRGAQWRKISKIMMCRTLWLTCI
jgi:hypothetical protein